MYGFYKAAAVTPTIKLGDTAHNAKVIADCIAAAANSGAKLLVLPKNIVTGSSLGDLFYLNDIQDKARAAMLSIQKATEQLDILV